MSIFQRPTIDSLLRHMVDMTGHRDHALLDIAVLSAVQELAAASQTRMLALTLVRGEVFLRARASISGTSAAKMEDYPDPSLPGAPISSFPELAACIARHEASADLLGADGRRTLWLPIWIGDRADTCLEIVHFTPYSDATIQVIGGIVSVYRNFQNLLDYSERDSLTGLLNRKTFDDQLSKLLQASTRQDALTLPDENERRHMDSESKKQWLAVVDVDHFKLVNDKFGHLYGDEVLILIANLMQSSFRAQDRIFRFGGEEFVVLLRSTTLVNAQKIIDRFRTNIEAHDFPQVGKVTVSVGFVSISAHEAPVIVLGRADQALYYAKSHGRNQACHYDELISGGLLHKTESNDTAEFF